MKKKLIYALIGVGGFIFLAIISLILYLQFTEYRPQTIEITQTHGKGSPLPADKTDFSFLSWNIGYAGLGKEMDFFFEGGKMVRSGKSMAEGYLSRISAELGSSDSSDFIFLQEVDRDSKRTYNLDQLKVLETALPGYCSSFAWNYKVGFIPFPVYEPIGNVNSGLCTFSKFQPETNERHAYDAFFSWPKRLVWLKRCFIVSSYAVCGGNQLIVVNLHNSAYDLSGELKRKEIAILQTYLEREYQKGSFIIVGGDWNLNPRGFRKDEIRSGDRVYSIPYAMSGNFMPGWQIVYDHTLPSNRDLDSPYKKGVTRTTVIDYFLISPNVGLLSCKTIDLGFSDSDHNPVFARFRLKANAPGFTMF